MTFCLQSFFVDPIQRTWLNFLIFLFSTLTIDMYQDVQLLQIQQKIGIFIC